MSAPSAAAGWLPAMGPGSAPRLALPPLPAGSRGCPRPPSPLPWLLPRRQEAARSRGARSAAVPRAAMTPAGHGELGATATRTGTGTGTAAGSAPLPSRPAPRPAPPGPGSQSPPRRARGRGLDLPAPPRLRRRGAQERPAPRVTWYGPAARRARARR